MNTSSHAATHRMLAALFAAVLLVVGAWCLLTQPAAAQAKTKHSSVTIAIDAGHQGKANLGKEAIGPGSKTKKYKVAGGTSGVSSKKSESSLTLAMAKRLQKELKSRGYHVYMIRTSQKVNISNKTRAKRANAHADIVIHLHADAASKSVRGATALYPSKSNKFVKKSVKTKSKTLASKVLKSYCKATKFKNRGLSARNDLTGLNWSKIPSIYLEMGFMTNAKDDKAMQKSSTQKKMAKGIANGIDAYYA